MSAHEQMRAMLDQLMGTARNGETDRGVKFSDDSVCKSFLLQCCPHEILSSTRMDLGDCPKVHDLALRADFELASKSKDYFYDIDATEHLEVFIADCDRRTSAAKQRLAETQEELSAEVAAKANAVHELAEQIGQKLAKAEALGEEGMVEESMKLMSEIEVLRQNKADAEQEYRNSMPASCYQQQKLRVCEVCSAYLGIHDNDRRLADHFGGKLHLGFITIREKLAELQKTLEKRRVERGEAQRDTVSRRPHYVGGRELDRRARRHRETRDRDREKERERRKSRSRSRERKEKPERPEREQRPERERNERERGDRDRGDRDRGDRDRGDREKNDREKSDRDKNDREKNDREKNDREKNDRDRNRDRSERDRSDRNRGDRERDRRSKSHRSSSRDRRRD